MTENAGKLLCINNGKCLYILQGVLELSLAPLLYMQILLLLPPSNEISKSLLHEAAQSSASLQDLPTLINYNQWLSSPLPRTRSHPDLL